jgi:signal transduction histidine kinase
MVIGGLCLIAFAFLSLAAELGFTVPGTMVVALGLLLFGGIIIWRGVSDNKRQKQVKQLEKEELAAYLHDSVLQNLALIQQNSGDQKQVEILARLTETELREWLYKGGKDNSEKLSKSLADSLQLVAMTIEKQFGVKIEYVNVGDFGMNQYLEVALKAVTQGLVNAVKHGKPSYNLYLEVTPTDAENTEIVIVIRDHGDGFDLAKIPQDRLGVKESIIGRIESIGGKAEYESRKGWGCQLTITL